MVNRVCDKTYQIPGSDVTIDKGVTCWVAVLGIHHDPEYYPEPEKFDPERFSEEEKEKRHPFTYLPFGEGPRNCIGRINSFMLTYYFLNIYFCLGMRFGLLQVKVGLVKLLKNFKFTLDARTKIPVELKLKGIMLAPKYPIWLNVHPVL